MKNFQILRYLKKLLPIIVVFCLLATYAIYLKLSASNTYIASEVIHYNDAQAEQGLAPNGDKLDVNEIKSSAVMSKVVDKMGLTGIYSVDSLISRIDITPIEDADKIAQKDAKLEEGEEYIYEPSTFIVSFSATSGEGSDFARTVLDEILNVYFEQFSQKYVNVAPANNTIGNLDKNDYDFIEMMELIDTSIDNTLTTLYQRIEQNNYYRATETGVSFAELADDFDYLRQVNVSSLFSKIYKYQITKNKSVLVSDYTTRIDNNNITNEKDESLVQDIVTVIDAYVRKMRESGNTNISYEYILDNLHERNLQDYVGDQTVTYDELIYSWRDHKESKEHAIIDSAYCRYILDTFTKCTGNCNGACATSNLTCSELCNAEYTAVREEVEKEINTFLDELTTLYDITTKTNDEYNKYLGASYISVLSSASVKESVNVPLYTAIAFFFLVVLCCGGAIVLGRAADIINYIFYADNLTGFSNSKTEYIYNGNGSFILLTEDSDYITVEDIMRLFRLRLDEREEHRDVVIEYKIGIAEIFKENKTARKLLSEAIESKKVYISDLKDKG